MKYPLPGANVEVTWRYRGAIAREKQRQSNEGRDASWRVDMGNEGWD